MLRRLIITLAASSLLAGCSVFGVRSDTETPAYEVVDRLGEDLEIRRYGARVAAEATVETDDDGDGRNKAFGLLFKYIQGANEGRREIAMTAPVETGERGTEISMTAPVETDVEASSSDKVRKLTMRFLLPATYSYETAPIPSDPKVSLKPLPPETLAVLRFSGSRGQEAVDARLDELRRRLAETQWTAAGAAITMFYDPPWTLPFLRRNEVAVPVDDGV
jgi:hypothetical protein